MVFGLEPAVAKIEVILNEEVAVVILVESSVIMVEFEKNKFDCL